MTTARALSLQAYAHRMTVLADAWTDKDGWWMLSQAAPAYSMAVGS